MNMNKKIWLSSPHMSEEGYEQQYVKEAFDTNWIAPLGPQVDAFELEIAEYCGMNCAAALSSGTAALHLALKLCGVTRGDYVICSSFTFAASANPIVYECGIPVFIDCDPDNWNMSSAALRRALVHLAANNRVPKAAIIVNLYGQSADMDELVAICDEYGVPVIEDAAESLGATYKGRKSGSIGRYGIYSFNGNKIITTSGGGMLVSNIAEDIKKARFWSTQARDDFPYYQHHEIGYNYRMSSICAAIGRGQMKVLDRRVEQRRAVNNYYRTELGCLSEIAFMPEAAYGTSNCWLTAVLFDLPKEKELINSSIDKSIGNFQVIDIMRQLSKLGIEARPLWKPLHLQPVFKDCAYFEHGKGFDASAYLFSRGLCLPSSSSLKKEELDYIAESIKSIVS